MDDRPRDHAARAYDALNRRDLDAFLAEIHEDVEFRSLIAEAEGEVFHGHDGVRRWWNTVAGSIGGLEFQVEALEEREGGGVVSRIRVRGTLGGTNVEQTMWQAIEATDDRAVWWGTFRSEEEATAALRERTGENHAR